MEYNMNYLYASLVFLIIVLYEFISVQKLSSLRNKVFILFSIVGVWDILFDIFSTILMEQQRAETLFWAKFTLTGIYTTHAILCFALVSYVNTLRNTDIRKIYKQVRLWLIPTALMIGWVFLNLKTGSIFYFDSNYVYTHGSYYRGYYYVASLYIFAIAFMTLIFRKQFNKGVIRAIWQIIVVVLGGMAIQLFNPHLLTTGLGISLAIMIAWSALDNPSSFIDNKTGAFNSFELPAWINEHMLTDKPLHCVTVRMMFIRNIISIYGQSQADQMISKSSQHIAKYAKKGYRFIDNGTIIYFTEDEADYHQFIHHMQQYFSEYITINNTTVRCPCLICGVEHSEKLKDADLLLDYLHHMNQHSAESTTVIESNDAMIAEYEKEKVINDFISEAIEKDLFEISFQPVYCMQRNDFCSLEALTRLKHPTIGYIRPDQLFQLAEKNGRVAQISLLQLQKICRFVKQNPSISNRIRNIKFNLSPIELLEQDHAQKLIDIITGNDLPTSFFQFEITETVATQYTDNIQEDIHRFLDAGIQLCLDDFGSGYANLNTVLALPFSVIKIDRSLLNGITSNKDAANFYRHIIMMLKDMDYHIVCEGVETKQEADLVESWGANMIQGFYYSRPLSVETVIEKFCNEQK